MENKSKGYFFVILTALVSGFSIFLNSFAVQGMSADIFTTAKNITVGIALLATIIGLKEFNTLKKLNIKQWGKLAIIGLIGGSIPFLLFFNGLAIAGPLNANFLHKSMFIAVTILAVLFLREKISKQFLIGATLLFTANILLFGIKITEFGLADLMILGATLFWASEQIISKQLLKEINAKIVAFGRMFFGSIFLITYLHTTGSFTELISLTIPQLSWVAISSGSLLLYVLFWYKGLQKLQASTATALLQISVGITFLLKGIFFGKEIALLDALGLVLMLFGALTIIGFSVVLNSIKPKMVLNHVNNK